VKSTSNAGQRPRTQRRKEVGFSPIFFVSGKLIVPKSSPVRSYRDLAGKTAVVTSGTTNEAALRTLSDKQSSTSPS
jgi:glutamate/aspartate transport system substrate-binding protein